MTLERVYLGFAERAHGVHGGLVIRCFFSEQTSELSPGVSLYLADSRYKLEDCRKHGEGRLLVSLKGLGDRNEAKALKGLGVFLDRSAAERFRGSYPLGVLCGMKVLSGGEYRGTIRGLDPYPGNMLLFVCDHSLSYSIPFALVRAEGSVDLDRGVVSIELPDGIELLGEKR